MDNYIPDVKQTEDHTAEEQAEEDEFLDAVVNTDIMKMTIDFLVQKNFLKSPSEAKSKLQELWFQRYDRDGTSNTVLGSSGFEHVFIGESKQNEVSGFHGWVHFYLEENVGNINYLGYIEHIDFGKNIHGLTDIFKWNGEMKPIGGGFIGTPPELDMAVYTICVLTRSGKPCPASFNGKIFNIKAFVNVNNGHQNVGSSFPEF